MAGPPRPTVGSLPDYVQLGGGRALKNVKNTTLGEVVEELARSGLRGSGGAGFPAGTKWGSILKGGGRHHYAVCNAAEGEPGTFKDRALIRVNPYQVIEGLVLAAQTVGAIEAFIAVKDSFDTETQRLASAIGDFEEAGWLEGLSFFYQIFLETLEPNTMKPEG